MWCFVAERGETYARASALHDETGTPHPPVFLEDTHQCQLYIYLSFRMRVHRFQELVTTRFSVKKQQQTNKKTQAVC